LIGAGIDAIGRLFRRPKPKGDPTSIYRAFQAGGREVLQNARINQGASVAKNTAMEALNAARNAGNRQAGAAIAQAVAPETMRAANQMFQGILEGAVQYDVNMRQMMLQQILQMEQLKQQRELAEAELKAQRQQRMLALLPALMQMSSGGNNRTA